METAAARGGPGTKATERTTMSKAQGKQPLGRGEGTPRARPVVQKRFCRKGEQGKAAARGQAPWTRVG